MNKILKIGHRGAMGHEPENTLISFQKAIELNVDMVELDVHLSKNNDVIVMHDEKINRTTDGHGKIINKDINELKRYKLNKKQHIPTLQEVLNVIKDNSDVNIEIKNKKAAKEVLKIWNANKLTSSSLISSNHVKTLKYIKKNNPEIQTALIFYATKTYFRQVIFSILCWIIWPLTKKIIKRRARKANVDWINLAKEFAFKNFIKKMQLDGYKIGIWIINKKRHIKKFTSYKVDAIISDYPDRL